MVVKARVKQKQRYFIVFYLGTAVSNGAVCTGFIDFTTNGCYLIKEITMQQILDKGVVTKPVITNIIELSYKDHKDWVSKDPN